MLCGVLDFHVFTGAGSLVVDVEVGHEFL